MKQGAWRRGWRPPVGALRGGDTLTQMRRLDGGASRPAPPLPRAARGVAGSLGVSATAVLAGIGVWELAVRGHVLPGYDLPAPLAVAREWWRLAGDGLLGQSALTTLSEALLGFALAFGVACLLALPLSRSGVLASLLSPYVAATQALPVLALAPILVVWFGLGLPSTTIICAVIVFFPILVNTAVGLRTVDRTLLEAAATQGAGRLATLVHVQVPLALPTILAGVRMGLTLSMTGAIVAEFVASSSGLGYLMMVARSQYDAPMLFAAAATIMGLAVAGYLLVGLIETWLVTWD